MSALTTQMANALSSPTVKIFHAVQIALANATINLIDGTGVVSFPVNNTTTTFTGYDPVYGSLDSISAIPEAISTQSSPIQISLMPPSTYGLAAIMDPTTQGSNVTVWFGSIDTTTGQAVVSPAQIFYGNIDFIKLHSKTGSRSVEMEIVPASDLFFVAHEANRLNDTFHEWLWPGETGMNQNYQAQIDPIWGASYPNPIYTPAPIPASLNDQLSGYTRGGYTSGSSFGPNAN